MDHRCCSSPSHVRAYVPFKPLGKSVYCERCGEITSDMNPVAEWLWENVLLAFWNGRVEIHENERVDS